MKLYALINRETNEVVRDKAYFKLKDAKLALKYHYGSRPQMYGIGVVERTATLAWFIDDNGKWEEAPANE